jgi:hypothetical protein
MRGADLVTASVLILLGLVVIVDAVRLGIGWGTDGPKSGFFPFWLAVIMVVTCGLVLLRAAGRGAPSRPFVTRAQLAPVLRVLGPALALVLLTQVVGLYVASLLYVGVYMRWVGRHSWGAVVALSIAIPLVSFVIFETWFLVPMPKGPLEHWLGY